MEHGGRAAQGLTQLSQSVGRPCGEWTRWRESNRQGGGRVAGLLSLVRCFEWLLRFTGCRSWLGPRMLVDACRGSLFAAKRNNQGPNITVAPCQSKATVSEGEMSFVSVP
jgi:hypothetical protein